MADGSGEFGGGGSVIWEVDVNDGGIPSQTPKPGNPKGYTQKGTDREGKDDSDKYFVIRIKPGDVKLGQSGGDLLVSVKIVKNSPGQIRVEWALTQAQVDALGANFTAR